MICVVSIYGGRRGPLHFLSAFAFAISRRQESRVPSLKKGVIAARFTIRQPKLASVTVVTNPATLSEPTCDMR